MFQDNLTLKPTAVLHVIDALDLGGAERMAVSIVNRLSRDRFRPFLCATRREGPLKEELKSDVGYVCLNRKSRFDLFPLFRFISFVKENKIEIIHAHSLSLFFCAIALLFLPRKIHLVWHDHYGLGDIKSRNPFFYKLALKKCAAIIAVNEYLEKWAKENNLALLTFRIPNFAETKKLNSKNEALPCSAEKRIICVANLRPEKDQGTLIHAMKIVTEKDKEAQLLLVGAPIDEKYAAFVCSKIIELKMENKVTWLGQRNDVADLLSQCAIGVLSSRSEGLPVALLEYGAAGLAVVATDVGQCAEVVRNDETGILIKPGEVNALAAAILRLLDDSLLRHTLGKNFRNLIDEKYSAGQIISQIEDIYKIVAREATH